MAMPAVTVYGPPIAPPVSRVLACLLEKEIEFKLVDLTKGGQRKPDFLKVEESFRFEDGSGSLSDSRRMCRKILKKYPNQGNKVLNGRNPSEKASIDKWVEIEEVTFDPLTTHLIDLQRQLPMRKTDGFQRSISIGRKEEKEMLTQAEQELGRLLDNYEKQLKKSPYLAGDVFTLADLYHLPNTQYLMSVPSQAKLFTSRENVRKWWDAISSRVSWKKVLEMQQKFLCNE